jgi:Matrixin
MKQAIAWLTIGLFLSVTSGVPSALAYTYVSTVPQSGGCPEPNHWNLSVSTPLDRQWSISLPTTASPVIITVAPAGSSAQLDEIEQSISDSFSVWAGVTGTTFNSVAYPGLEAPIARVTNADSCTDDAGDNVDGLNTICFNQPSDAFTPGVLAFTRTFVANAPGVSVGASGSSIFAGQILDADTLFCNTGEVTFATPAALATTQGAGAYDLESLLTHELGHWMGLDHSAVIRAMMFPYAPPPGQFLGLRPTAQVPDGPLSDDDRTGIRVLYPDPNDTVNIGAIRGQILPANPFALADIPATSTGLSVTGIVGAQVVALDADTGAIVAGAFSSGSCNPASPPTRFDGTYDLERLPVGRNYNLYAEPLVGIALPSDFDVPADLCSLDVTPSCTAPGANTNFNVRTRPASP